MTVDREYNFGMSIKNETIKNLEYFFRNSDKISAYFFLSAEEWLDYFEHLFGDFLISNFI